ncbi:hypothetical protein AYI70_g8054 [Smittium culicis]|uniref:Uncharacterized protein n=1 Tax=Smittium culicis TaxID=133412 RepID=A0A1R1XHN7_9FUNG|nr:hypothetical protein AYI70_g8054 [Smittium culicis]
MAVDTPSRIDDSAQNKTPESRSLSVNTSLNNKPVTNFKTETGITEISNSGKKLLEKSDDGKFSEKQGFSSSAAGDGNASIDRANSSNVSSLEKPSIGVNEALNDKLSASNPQKAEAISTQRGLGFCLTLPVGVSIDDFFPYKKTKAEPNSHNVNRSSLKCSLPGCSVAFKYKVVKKGISVSNSVQSSTVSLDHAVEYACGLDHYKQLLLL